MARKTIDKAAVERVMKKLEGLASSNWEQAKTIEENKEYFMGKYDAYTAASYRLKRMLDSDGRDS